MLLANLLGVAGVLVASIQLVRPTLPLRVQHTQFCSIPITVCTSAGAVAGTSIIIAHGFAGSQQLMHPFAVTLGRNGYTAIIFDFPGQRLPICLLILAAMLPYFLAGEWLTPMPGVPRLCRSLCCTSRFLACSVAACTATLRRVRSGRSPIPSFLLGVQPLFLYL
jgi:hypothetical protein